LPCDRLPRLAIGTAFSWTLEEGEHMSARLPSRADRFERVFRGLLGLALVAGVAWALTHGGTTGAGIGPLR
jgi:hypothetical protein